MLKYTGELLLLTGICMFLYSMLIRPSKGEIAANSEDNLLNNEEEWARSRREERARFDFKKNTHNIIVGLVLCVIGALLVW